MVDLFQNRVKSKLGAGQIGYVEVLDWFTVHTFNSYLSQWLSGTLEQRLYSHFQVHGSFWCVGVLDALTKTLVSNPGQWL